MAGQVSAVLGASAAVPLADFGDVADLGFRTTVGGTAELGSRGAVVGASAFYGRNPHQIAGERSDLYGLTVLGGYRFDVGRGLRVTPWGGVGAAVHSRKSEPYPGLEATRRGLTLNGGATLSRPVGRVGVFVSAFYTRGLGDLGGSTFPTELVTVGAGVEVPLKLE